MSTSTSTSTSTQKTNVLEYEYDYFTIYSSTSTITLQYKHDYFHDYFNEYPVSNIKATFMESLGVILVLLLCHQCSNWLLLSTIQVLLLLIIRRLSQVLDESFNAGLII